MFMPSVDDDAKRCTVEMYTKWYMHAPRSLCPFAHPLFQLGCATVCIVCDSVTYWLLTCLPVSLRRSMAWFTTWSACCGFSIVLRLGTS